MENIIVAVIVVIVVIVGAGAWWYENYGPNETQDDAGNKIDLSNRREK